MLRFKLGQGTLLRRLLMFDTSRFNRQQLDRMPAFMLDHWLILEELLHPASRELDLWCSTLPR